MATLAISRFPCREFCVHALVLRLRRFNVQLALLLHAMLSSPSDYRVDNLILVISELNSQACTPPVNASLHPCGIPTHDSGPQLVASLYHAGTFTLFFLPAFTGAFGPTRQYPKTECPLFLLLRCCHTEPFQLNLTSMDKSEFI